MSYKEELDKYVLSFNDKLAKSFEMVETIKFTKTISNKIKTQFGYKINTTNEYYTGSVYDLKEFSFKWGFDDDLPVFDNTNFNADEFYVSSPKMEGIVQKTIDEQESFFDAIIARLLLQGFFAILNITPENIDHEIFMLPVTRANSSIYGSIDYVEYIFRLVVFDENSQR